MLLLSACNNSGSTTSSYDPFIGGSEGLDMSFITQSPPDEIYDSGKFPFSVSVQLTNLGESDVEDGFVEIRGISAQEFGVSDSDLKEDIPQIEGAKKNADGSIMKGLTEVVTFKSLNYQPDLAGDLPIENFRVRACYDYQTKASAKLCIKPKGVDGMKENELCTIAESKSVANSGSPIHITNLVERPKGEKSVMISFDIINAGPSNFKWFPKGDDSCDDSLDNSDLYKLEVEVLPIVDGRYPAKCGRLGNSNKGDLTLFNGQPQTISCEFDVGSQSSDFETPVSIVLNYRYLEYVEKTILIKDIGISS